MIPPLWSGYNGKNYTLALKFQCYRATLFTLVVKFYIQETLLFRQGEFSLFLFLLELKNMLSIERLCCYVDGSYAKWFKCWGISIMIYKFCSLAACSTYTLWYYPGYFEVENHNIISASCSVHKLSSPRFSCSVSFMHSSPSIVIVYSGHLHSLISICLRLSPG